MKILIADDEPEILSIVSFYLQSFIEAEIVIAYNGEEVIQLVKQHPDIDLIICDYNMPKINGGEVYKYLVKQNLTIPFVLCSSAIPDQHPEFSEGNIFLHHLSKPNIFSGIETMLMKLKKWKEHDVSIEKVTDKYVSVAINLLQTIGKLPADVFIKLSEGKVVKALKKEDLFGLSDFNKYSNSGINELFIAKKDIELFAEELEKKVFHILSDPELDDEFKLMSLQDTITSSINSFGFSDRVTKITVEYLNFALDLVKQDKSLNDRLQKLLSKKDSYLATHASIMCFVSTALSIEMSWSTDITAKKLVIASLMHDLCLNESQFDERQMLKNYPANKNSPDFKKYAQHISESAELVLRLKNVPSDVDKIILEHHERPDGSGFNRGLSGGQISPLGAIMIFSHDLADLMIDGKSLGQMVTMKYLIENMLEEKYKTGNFKKVFEAFQRIKLFG